MEIVGELSEATTTQAKLARYLGLSKPRITQLVDEQVVVRDESDSGNKILAFDSVRNYYLSKNSTGDDNVNFWKERALHEQINRKRDELKLKTESGELYNAADVESAFADLVIILRTHLLGIPNKISPVLESKNRAEIFEILNAELNECLNELANFDVKNFSSSDDCSENQAEETIQSQERRA